MHLSHSSLERSTVLSIISCVSEFLIVSLSMNVSEMFF